MSAPASAAPENGVMIPAEPLRRLRGALEDALAAVEPSVARDVDRREAHARALWRDARTPELRAHLRQLYGADLFRGISDPPPPRPIPPGPDYPPGFGHWPLEKRNGWWAAFNLDRIEREAGR